MAAHPVRTNPAFLTSALRAALIALVLLGVLAVIVLL
jgi:hypothetical protein